jgi:citrate lyase subunit beta/citryl-CoA lyase
MRRPSHRCIRSRAMRMRSLLFVPGDSERKLSKSAGVKSDVLILDLEDSVAPSQKEMARENVRTYLANSTGRSGTQLWVRINPVDLPEAMLDLARVMSAAPDGIIQPKTRSPDDVIRLAHYLDAFEAEHGLPPGSTKIVPIATETPEAIFSLGGFMRSGARLAGLTWGSEDLSTAVGAVTNKQADGSWSHPFQLARSLCLFGAHAAGVPAIDTLFADIRDPAGLRASCTAARRDGFSGKLAIHPDQVAVINECFTPSAEEVAHARRIIALFGANPGVGTLAMDGQMVDIPHLRQAQRIAAAAEPSGIPGGG